MTRTIVFPDNVAERLDKLAQLNGTYSPEETVARALAIYECILQNQARPNFSRSWVKFVGERTNGELTEYEIDIK